MPLKFFSLLLFIQLINPTKLWAYDYGTKNDWGQDSLDAVKLLGEGSYRQFQSWGNLAHMGIFGGALWYTLEEDDRLSASMRRQKKRGLYGLVSDSAIVMNFPIVPAISYYFGRKNSDDKLIRFAKEVFAANYLAAIESSIISQFVDIHVRPDSSNANFFETAFRGNSSFPSGHVIPYTVLTWKLAQFYGPWWGLVPVPFMVITAYERMNSGKHFPSDVVGGMLLSVCASEGVRIASSYDDNHPFYQWIYQHQVSFTPILRQGHYGALASWHF